MLQNEQTGRVEIRLIDKQAELRVERFPNSSLLILIN